MITFVRRLWKRWTTYYQYSDLPLKTYFLILETGNLKPLKRRGIFSDDGIHAWEQIIIAAEQANSGIQYATQLDDIKEINWLFSEYIVVKSLLMRASFEINHKVIERLADHDHPLDTSSSPAYAASILNQQRRVENFVTLIAIKQKEITKQRSTDKATLISFDSVMAELSKRLHFSVPENITLARFDAYSKVLKDGRRSNDTEREAA